MKRLLVLPLVALLALLSAAAIQLAWTPAPTPQHLVASDEDDPNIDELIKKLLEEDKPAAEPAIKRPKLAKGERWVPVLRFTNAPINRGNVEKIGTLMAQVSAAGADAIVLELNTLGGDVPSGYEFGRAIERSPVPVHCVVDGDAASMGFYVLQSCATRTMTKRSVVMIHEPHVRAELVGTQSDYKQYEKGLHATSEAMLEHEAHRMKLSKDEVRKHIEHGQDWAMLYGEALEVGAVDGVVASVESVAAYYAHNAKGHPKYL